VGAGLLVAGVLELLSALGIFGHRGWGRLLGMFLSLVAIVASIVGIVWAANLGEMAIGRSSLGTVSALPQSVDLFGVLQGTFNLEAASIPAVPLVFYAIIFLCLLFGGGHFRLKEVQSDA
jgi:hypothetical protein